MRPIGWLLILYPVAWLGFAIFDFKGSDTIIGYQIQPTFKPENHLPKKTTITPTVYRISSQSVISQTAEFPPNRLSDCSVMDVKNWICTYSDKSGEIGFTDGDYFNRCLISCESFKSLRNRESVSRFRWLVVLAKWHLADDWGFIAVLILPFIA
jgi:hypothetical protein